MTPAQPESLRHRTVTTSDGVVLPVVEAGDPAAAPVVLLHGLASSWRAWEQVMADPRLLERHRLVALNLRGHGDDPAPLTTAQADVQVEGAAQRLWASDLEAVLADLTRPHVVGWSFGCSVTMGWIREHGGLGDVQSFTMVACPPVLDPGATAPDPAASVLGLEALGVVLDAATGGEQAYAERVLRRGEGDTTIPRDLLARVAATAATTRPEAVQAAGGFGFDQRASLRALPDRDRQRVQAVVCELDGVYDAAPTRACWEQTGVQTRVLPGEGHGAPMRDPSRVTELVLEHLALNAGEGTAAARP